MCGFMTGYVNDDNLNVYMPFLYMCQRIIECCMSGKKGQWPVAQHVSVLYQAKKANGLSYNTDQYSITQKGLMAC